MPCVVKVAAFLVLALIFFYMAKLAVAHSRASRRVSMTERLLPQEPACQLQARGDACIFTLLGWRRRPGPVRSQMLACCRSVRNSPASGSSLYLAALRGLKQRQGGRASGAMLCQLGMNLLHFIRQHVLGADVGHPRNAIWWAGPNRCSSLYVMQRRVAPRPDHIPDYSPGCVTVILQHRLGLLLPSAARPPPWACACQAPRHRRRAPSRACISSPT